MISEVKKYRHLYGNIRSKSKRLSEKVKYWYSLVL